MIKVGNGKVCELGYPALPFTEYPYSHMRLLNHLNVIITIPYTQTNQI